MKKRFKTYLTGFLSLRALAILLAIASIISAFDLRAQAASKIKPNKSAQKKAELTSKVEAVAPVTQVILNQVLFHLNNDVFTSFDLNKFLKFRATIMAALEPNSAKTVATLSDINQFLLFLVARLEADALGLSLDEKNLPELKSTHPQELQFYKAVMYLQTKETLFSNKDRLIPWIELVKKKYNFVAKAD